MKNGPDLANGFEWTIGDVGPSESEHSPPGGLREVVSSAVAFKGFGQGVPSAAVTLDDQPLIRKSDVDPTVDRCSPRHGHLQDRLCESLHVEEFEHPILEFALRGGIRDRQIAKEFTHRGGTWSPAPSDRREDFVKASDRSQSAHDGLIDNPPELAFSESERNVEDRSGWSSHWQVGNLCHMAGIEIGRFVDGHTYEPVREPVGGGDLGSIRSDSQ